MSGMALRPMSVGEILDRAFQVYRRSFAVMFVVALLGMAPVGAVTFMMPQAGQTSESVSSALGLLLAALPLLALISFLVWGALAELFDRAVRGEAAALGPALGTGLRAMLPLAAAHILVALIVIVPLGILSAILIPAFAAGRARGAGGSAVPIVALVLVLAIMAAAMLWTVLAFFLTPAIVVEPQGIVASIGRSSQLGKGARWRILGIAILAVLIVIMPGLAIDLVPEIASLLGSRTAPGLLGPTANTLYLVAKVAVGALTTPFTVGCTMMAYYDRRVRLEGLDVELASAALEPTA